MRKLKVKRITHLAMERLDHEKYTTEIIHWGI